MVRQPLTTTITKDVEIHNVSDFLQWIKQIGSSPKEPTQMQPIGTFYRGQCNCEWKIVPSLYVNGNDEYESIHRATLYAKDIAKGCTCLEKLIIFQHYGLHTRLLDVTSNPLVALYFACLSDGENKDGVVYFGYSHDTTFLDKAETIATIVSLNNLSSSEIVNEKKLKDWIEEYSLHYTAKQLADILCNPIYFEAPQNSDRIIAQQGAFIIAPPLEEREGLYWYRDKYVFSQNYPKDKYSIFAPEVVDIPTKYKKGILSELDTVNINEQSLFPEMEHLMHSINERYANKRELTIL